MDFYELDAFVTLARHLHFARAASAINTSPSALSRIVTRLEEETGARLFERDTRRVELTEAGGLFLTFAEESLRSRDALHLRLGAADGQLRGTLRVYASVTACYSILPPLAEALRLNHPELKLSVDTGDPAGAEVVVRSGSVDLALAALPDGGFHGLECFSVRRTPLVFATSREGAFGHLSADLLPQDLAAEGSPAARLSRHWAETLIAQPLILPSRGIARDRFDRWARRHHFHPRIAAETSGNEAVLALARLGLGLGLVPHLVLENSPFSEGLVIYPAGTALGDYDIGFILPPSSGSTSGAPGLALALKSLLSKVFPQGSWVV